MDKPKKITEPTPPKELLSLQEWMSATVSAPLDTTPDPIMAAKFITASQSLSSKERLTIYTHDYWPRCIDSLEEDFPLLQAFLGEETFKQIITQFLEKYPSKTHTLYYLGQALPQFFHTDYTGEHQSFLENLVTYEWLKCDAYFAAQDAAFDPSALSETEKATITTKTLQRQAYVHTFQCHAHYAAWKVKPKKLPKIRPIYAIIYRDLTTFAIKEDALSYPFFRLMEVFQDPITLEDAVEKIWPDLKGSQQHIATSQIQTWMATIIKKGWLKELK